MDPYLEPPIHAVRAAVALGLAEDLAPLGDLTSALLRPGVTATARFVSRSRGVIAGVACVEEAFRQVAFTGQVRVARRDGARVEPHAVIVEVEGPLAPMLTAERTALNFLGHLSGVATATAAFVQRCEGTGARIWDTRKTTPGLRALEKAAVRAGGGRNHRGNLSDWMLLKDNHLAGVSITDAILLARDRWPGRTVHVECERLDQVEEALTADADAILLDNMTPAEITECVALAREHAAATGRRRPLLEASGGITLDTVADYATTGVDQISVGSITNSAPVLDIGLDLLVGGAA